VPRLGERRAVLLGLAVSAAVSALYGIVPQGWMVFPVMAFGILGWTIAQPATQALMSQAVPANEQGLLQGALASMTNLTSIAGPPIWTGLFGYFVSPAAPVVVPGAAFFAGAIVFLAALVLAARWFALTAAVTSR
jgi:DHA1 family tetracycline resistance protein-like MFS transporter